jgi:hypothetical protein
MGYISRYTLVRADDSTDYDAPTFISRLARINASAFSEPQTWYEHDQDIARAMRESGARFVAIRVNGEESGDRCDKEYRPDGDAIVCRTFRHEFVRPDEPTEETKL